MTTLVDSGPALRRILLDDAAVAALVGARIYRSVLPQKPVVPAVSYFEVSGQGDHHNAGPSGLAAPRVQISCWGETADDAAALGLKVKAALDGYRGEVTFGPNSPPDAVTFRGVFFDSSRDLYDDVAKLHYRSIDFIVWHAEF